MNRRSSVARSREQAFTLIELLVVIIILAILAAVVIPKVINRTEDARIAKATSDISTLDNTMETYKLDTGEYPTADEGLNAFQSNVGNNPKWGGPYLKNGVPQDPWGNPYVYESPGANGEDFSITSYGADGAAGGSAENADITSE